MNELSGRLVLVLLLVSIFVFGGVGLTTVAATDTPLSDSDRADVVATDTQAGSVDIISDDRSQSTDGSNDSSDTTGLTTTKLSSTSTSHLKITAKAQIVETQDGDAEARIYAGVRNESGEIPTGVNNATIFADIIPPEGSTVVKNVTTNEQGYAIITYNPEKRGKYDVEVSFTSGSFTTTTYESFNTGPAAYFYPSLHDNLQTGETVNMGVALVNGSTFSPITDASRTVDIETPSGTISKDFTTDADGVATFEFTPSSSGEYYINENSLQNTTVETYNSYTASKITGAVRFSGDYRDNIAPGKVAGIYGQLRSGGETATDRNLNITLTNESTDNIVFSGKTQTNQFGQFKLNWTTPDINTEHGYEINIETEDGTEVAGESFASTIRVEPSYSDTGAGEGPSRELETNIVGEEDYEAIFAPGEQVTAQLTVRENGSAVANAPVELRGTAGYRGPIIVSGSTTTNSSGVAEVTFTVPQQVKRLISEDLRLSFYATIDDQTFEETAYTTISNVEYEQENEYQTRTGESLNYTITTTDGAGNPASGVTTYVFPELNDFHASVVGAEAVTTDSDGKVQTSFTPQRGGDFNFGDFGRYNDPNFYSGADVTPYDVTIESESDLYGEFAPGETITLSYSDTAANETKATVAVHAGDDDYKQVDKDLLYLDHLSSSESATFTIPADTPTGVDYQVTVAAATKPGTRVVESRYLDITSDNTAPTAEFSYGPTPITVGSDIVFNATNSTDADGSISSYEWDLDGDGSTEATGETITHAYNGGDIYDVTLTVTDDGGVTDTVTKTLTVAPDIEAPSNSTYDPSKNFTLGTGHDAVGIIDSSDVAVRLVNVTDGSTTVVATNDSAPQIGHVNTTIPAGTLYGNVTIEVQLYNTSSDTVEASDNVGLTAVRKDSSQVSDSAPYIAEPADDNYDPDSPLTVGTFHNATGVISSNDVAIRILNVTNENDTQIALNDTVPVKGESNTTIPASALSGNVSIEIQLYNTSTGVAESQAILNLTAIGTSDSSLVVEDAVPLSGSTITVNTGGENAIAVENLPTNVTISNISGSGVFNSDERSILYSDFSDEGLPATVTFRLDPDDSVYTTNDTVTFSVDRTEVSLDVIAIPEALKGDVTGDQYAAVLDGSDELTASNLADAINGWAENGKVKGVEMGALELSRLINYWANK